MATYKRAREIDAAFASFLRTPAAKGATQLELDTLQCWRWEPGYVPRRAEYAHLLLALRLGASRRMSIALRTETVGT
jgi:hypothetical protein